jgi:subtilisin family serine protease
VQFDKPQLGVALAESSQFIRAVEARATFKVDGTGLCAAVLDTGLRVTHVDFAGRVAAQRNFTADNGGRKEDVADGNGHGTNVTGILAARGDHVGIAPGARVVPLKVLPDAGGGSFAAVAEALQWVIDHRKTHNITVVNMSLSDGGNVASTDPAAADPVRDRIRALREAGVAVVVAAGNSYFGHQTHGMGYPAILPGTVSVGAVYDGPGGPYYYSGGAVAYSAGPGRVCPFSQRLHPSTSALYRTDVFAPGAPVTSSGNANDHGESVQSGTSQAAPVTAGVILLLQEFHLRATGRLPSVEDLEAHLRKGAVKIVDGDDEHDNVAHDNADYLRIDALGALQSLRADLTAQALLQGTAVRQLDLTPEARAKFQTQRLDRPATKIPPSR